MWQGQNWKLGHTKVNLYDRQCYGGNNWKTIHYSVFIGLHTTSFEWVFEFLCCLSDGMFLGIHDNEKMVSPLVPCYEFGCALSNYLFVLPQNHT